MDAEQKVEAIIIKSATLIEQSIVSAEPKVQSMLDKLSNWLDTKLKETK
jgi:hypothetical protein